QENAKNKPRGEGPRGCGVRCEGCTGRQGPARSRPGSLPKVYRSPRRLQRRLHHLLPARPTFSRPSAPKTPTPRPGSPRNALRSHPTPPLPLHQENSMPGRLQDKVAIITGAGAGIGEAIAHKFAHEGASVLVADDNADHLRDVDDTLRRQGCRVASYAGDLADDRHAQACVQAAVDKFGRLDILVNNAGVFLANAETQEYPVEAFDRQLRANVRSCFLMTRAALPHLRKTRGNIVSAGSESGELGIAQNT